MTDDWGGLRPDHPLDGEWEVEGEDEDSDGYVPLFEFASHEPGYQDPRKSHYTEDDYWTLVASHGDIPTTRRDFEMKNDQDNRVVLDDEEDPQLNLGRPRLYKQVAIHPDTLFRRQNYLAQQRLRQ